jgi:hypothetical protein
MIFVTYRELHKHVDMSKLNEGVIMEAFDHLRGGEKGHFFFTNVDEYKFACAQYAIKQGWDPETTLVLFQLPPTDEERAARAAETAKKIEEDPDWDDIQIGQVDPKQVICSLHPNLSLEKLVSTLNSFGNLKAFL